MLKKKHNLLSVAYPFIQLYRMFGLFPYRLSDDPVSPLRFSVSLLLFSFVVASSILACRITWLINFKNKSFEHLDWVGGICQTCLVLIVNGIMYVSAWARGKRTATIIFKLMVLFTQYKNEEIYKKIWRCFILATVITVFFLVTSITFEYKRTDITVTAWSPLIATSEVVMLVEMIMFASLVRTVMHFFRRFNDMIQDIEGYNHLNIFCVLPDINIHNVISNRKQRQEKFDIINEYDALWELSRDINNLYGINVFVILLAAFTAITYSIYHFILEFAINIKHRELEYNTILNVVVWFLMALICSVISVVACSSVTEEVSLTQICITKQNILHQIVH